MAEKKSTKKRVVKVEVDPASKTEWKASDEAKGSATGLRWGAWILWIVAIAIEAAAIWWLLDPEGFPFELEYNLWILIGVFVVIGILAIIGSQLWKKANKLDPAKKADAFRFFVQNQLGAIITVIAFLPLIIVVLLSKDIDQRDKTIVGAVGGVLLIVAVLLGIEFDPASVEENTAAQNDYPVESERIIELTGADEVFWVEGGSVYHLCEIADDVNIASESGEIYQGTVAAAHADGMEGLTLEIEDELGDCGFEIPENVDEIVEEVRAERELASSDA